jgi:hypothetical protein
MRILNKSLTKMRRPDSSKSLELCRYFFVWISTRQNNCQDLIGTTGYLLSQTGSNTQWERDNPAIRNYTATLLF